MTPANRVARDSTHVIVLLKTPGSSFVLAPPSKRSPWEAPLPR